MYGGGYLVLIVVGALLRWAVTYHARSFDIQTAGLIIMIVGIIGLAVAVLFWFDGRGYAAPWRRVHRFDGELPYGYHPPVQDRIVHERVVQEAPPTHERVVREYVPPPRDAEDEGIADWSKDDTPANTTEERTGTVPSQPGPSQE